MPELDEKRVREIVKEEITDSKINEKLAVIETKLDMKADKADLTRLEDKFDNIKEDVKDIKKYIIGFSIAVIVAVIGAALAK